MRSDQLKLHHFDGFEMSKPTDLIDRNNRLFLPLDERWHQLFREGKKNWELRGINNRFNTKTVREGRTVELRRGYQSDPLWGIITDRLIINSFKEIPSTILDKTIPLTVRNDPNVIAFVKDYEDKYDNFILFKIRIVEEG